MQYVHTNLIAKDWKLLSQFYQNVFGCTPSGHQRNLSGEWIKHLTGLDDIIITGEHLFLPGFGSNAPTLEIFSYSRYIERSKDINAIGFSHIAFEVEDVKATAEILVNEGGSLLGEIVEKDYGTMGIGTFAYAKDPEGNHIEVQSWNKDDNKEL